VEVVAKKHPTVKDAFSEDRAPVKSDVDRATRPCRSGGRPIVQLIVSEGPAIGMTLPRVRCQERADDRPCPPHSRRITDFPGCERGRRSTATVKGLASGAPDQRSAPLVNGPQAPASAAPAPQSKLLKARCALSLGLS